MYDTQVTLVGNLVADPRIHTLPDGQVVASFRIASTRRRFDRPSGQWRDFGTTYANVTCWRGLGENAAASLKKGQAAIVWGRLSVRPYETKEGGKRESVDIDAIAVGPDLSRVITLVKRAERSASASASQADAWAAGIPERAPGAGAGRDGVDGVDGAAGDSGADEDDELGADVRDGFGGEPRDDLDGFADADDDIEAADELADRRADESASAAGGGELVGAGASAGIGAGVGVGAASGGRLKARFGIG
ncbi:MAG: single-stranded DNA-binding protein [Acidothermaceae bacterium]